VVTDVIKWHWGPLASKMSKSRLSKWRQVVSTLSIERNPFSAKNQTFNILQSIYFAYIEGIISSYSNRLSVCMILLLQQKPKLSRTKLSTGAHAAGRLDIAVSNTHRPLLSTAVVKIEPGFNSWFNPIAFLKYRCIIGT